MAGRITAHAPWSSYDPQLRSVYTDLTVSHVLSKRFFTAAIYDDVMTDNSPLFKTISGYLDEAMLAAIDGRLLPIGTSISTRSTR